MNITLQELQPNSALYFKDLSQAHRTCDIIEGKKITFPFQHLYGIIITQSMNSWIFAQTKFIISNKLQHIII